MKKLILIVVFTLFLCGCNSLRTFPLYSEIYIERLDYIQLFDGYNPEFVESVIKKRSLYLKIEARVAEYLSKNQNIDTKIADALKELIIEKGMNKEQVFTVVGGPTRKKILKDNNEIWIYKGDRLKKNEAAWYYKWGKLQFYNGTLADIEVQHIKIYK